MSNRTAEIQSALDAIKNVSDADVTISREAIGEIERLVGTINTLTDNPEVRQEGRYLVSRAMGRYTVTPEGGPSSIVWAARLHGAVARYEFALRRAGLLPAPEGEPRLGNEAPQRTG